MTAAEGRREGLLPAGFLAGRPGQFAQSALDPCPTGQPSPTQKAGPLSTAARPDGSCGTRTVQVPGRVLPAGSVTT